VKSIQGFEANRDLKRAKLEEDSYLGGLKKEGRIVHHESGRDGGIPLGRTIRGGGDLGLKR